MADTDKTKTSDQSKKTTAKSGVQATGPTNEVTSSTNPESSGGAAATPATASSVGSGEASQTETQKGSDSAKSGTESGSHSDTISGDQPGDKTGASVTPSATSEPADTTAADQAAKDAVAVVVDNAKGEDKATVQKRVDEALVNAGVDTQPTMVNGRSVVGKKLSDDGSEWVDDPDYAGQAGVRAEDIFDRIGNAFPHEPQRLVIEELARIAGATAESTVDLPEGQPTLKSTASLRTDVSGYGRSAGGRGTQGGIPVAPGRDGKAQVENNSGDSES